MKNESRRKILVFSVATVFAKVLSGQITGQGDDIKQIGGTSGLPSTLRPPQQVAMEKHEQNLEDLEKLEKMVRELKADLERNGPLTFQAPAVKSADQMQKLAKKIYDRLRR
jgi:hypothetical protein